MRFVVLSFCLFFASVCMGDYVRVDNNANVYAQPDKTSAVLEQIRPEEVDHTIFLSIVGNQLENGYHHVQLQHGTGWIYKTRVRKFAGDIPGQTATTVFGGFPDDAGVGDQVIRLQNASYVVGYSETKTNPLWVAYRLGATGGHQCPRLPRFRTDNRSMAAITHDDYTNAGYDRGHMAPSSNVGSRNGCDAQNETYFMTNIAPQNAVLNQRSWGGLENLEDEFPTTLGPIWIFTGPIFDSVWLNRLCSGVEIPVAFYKIIVREANGTPEVLATIFEQTTAPGVPLSSVIRTVDEIEERTGINFMPGLPDGIENALERVRATGAQWQLGTALDTNFRPGARPLCAMPRVRRDHVDPDQ